MARLNPIEEAIKFEEELKTLSGDNSCKVIISNEMLEYISNIEKVLETLTGDELLDRLTNVDFELSYRTVTVKSPLVLKNKEVKETMEYILQKYTDHVSYKITDLIDGDSEDLY